MSRVGGNPNLPKGRLPGHKNKFSHDVKKMVLEAINQRGGVEFFRKLPDTDLARLAGKLIPREIRGSLDINTIVDFIKGGYSAAERAKDEAVDHT